MNKRKSRARAYIAIAFVVVVGLSLLVYQVTMSACEKFVGVYSKLDFSSAQIRDMINYDHVWLSQLNSKDATFEQLVIMQKQRMEIEIKLLRNLEAVFKKMESL